MSESEVSQIRDEDVLRRMWQQTEDFSRKKEIRAHMYRLREERLRNLYSPEPTSDGKGCEFSSAQGHVKSFADQTFQSMKSKEVRDAGSPPKEFSYRGQELKELSNAGWNVESEDRTTDDGRTHVKSVNANIEGQYDVEGGRGQFAALDQQRRAVTEHHDATSSLRRDELSSASASRDHVQRHTDDGTRVSTTTSSSNTSSKFQEVSSTKHEAVPYVTDDDDLSRRTARDTNRNEKVTRITNRDYEQTLRRNDYADSELVSRKIEYPDDNTKVIVETRCMPDGTRVTSTRREFRAPAQSSRSEHQSRSETRSYSSHHKSDSRDSTSKISRQTIDNHTNDIVDSQRNVDDYDFKRQLREYTVRDNDDQENTQQRYVTKSDKKVADYTQTDDNFSQKHHETRVNSKVIDHSVNKNDDQILTQQLVTDRRTDSLKDETNRHHTSLSRDHDFQKKVVKETFYTNDTEEQVHNISKKRKSTEEKNSNISRHQANTVDRVYEYNTPQDKKMPGERIIDDPSERKVPLDKTHKHIPSDVTLPADRIRDVPRDETTLFNVADNSSDRTVPADKVTDASRFGSTPTDQNKYFPKDRTAPVDKLCDVPKIGTAPTEKVYDIHQARIATDERVHNITRNTKVEEVIERKTSSDHYQTTYQDDFQSRKISTDWSPTHQAWASTLRADTPSTTHPSTRASSPGSRTFKSSTSSLRSSVSPDKTFKKPSSRGTSPNKVDRYSPTRTVSADRYSSTHSTQSATEVRTKQNTSPERKPPTGRSPTRPGYSPDQKLQDVHRQRPSVSPEKKPQKFTGRPGSSPERNSYEKSTPTNKWPRNASPSGKGDSTPSGPRKSPERKPTHQTFDKNHSDEYQRTSPYRSTISPDRKPIEDYRKPGFQNDPSPTRQQPPSETVPRRSKTSPDRKLGYQQPRQSPDKTIDKHTHDSFTKRPSVSPDRKPSYMKPTVASQSDDKTRRSPNLMDEPERPSPSKQIPVQTPVGKPQDFNKSSKIKEDHYRFVDAETKVYTRSDKKDIDNKISKISKSTDSSSRDKSPSPITKISKDSPDFCKGPFNKGKSPSPPKDTATIYDTDKNIKNTEIVTKHDRQSEDILTKSSSEKKYSLESNDVPSSDEPVKYGTYEKKKLRDTIKYTEQTTINNEVKQDSKSLRDKKSPINEPGILSSPTKKSPRDSTSPVKSPSRDSKFKQTSDFLCTEKTTEETNKKITTKDRPRQLITPSSSPTRKPKNIDPEPSTGQSSPTTSVSGFVYFGSPPAETHLVTDLDDFYPENSEETFKRPETLDIKRSPSPSKIPCRSPSPEKHVPTTKENLPRKSSLKKPSTGVNQASPIEKPPTSFRVSPTDDKSDSIRHKIIKKDNPSEPETGEPEIINSDFTVKPKPPLQRRETYEDRCKKILGMVDDTTTETVMKDTRKLTKNTNSNQSSLSVSPCDSPAPKESSPFQEYTSSEKTTTTKVEVTDFITNENENFSNTTITCENKKIKTTPREQSPTKLQDIVKKQEDASKEPVQKRPSVSPDRKTSKLLNQSQPLDKSLPKSKMDQKDQTNSEKASNYTKNISLSKTDSILTDASVTVNIVEITQPTKKNEPSTQEIPTSIPDLPGHSKHPQKTSPSRSITKEGSPVKNTFGPDSTPVSNSVPDNINQKNIQRESPEKTTNYVKSTITTTSEYDVTYGTKDTDEIYTTKNKRSNENLKSQMENSSPTRQPSQDSPRAGSPTKAFPSYKKPDLSPQRQSPKNVSVKKPSGEVPTDPVLNKRHELPGYMKSTTAKTAVSDTTIASENILEKTKTTITRKVSLPKLSPEHRSPSPTKSSRTSNISPERKPSKPQQASSPTKESPINKPEYLRAFSPTEAGSDKTPGYMKATASVTSKFETSEYDSKTKKDFHESKTSSTTEKELVESRKSISPIRHPKRPIDGTVPESGRISPLEPLITTFDAPRRQVLSPEGKPGNHPIPKDYNSKEKTAEKHPKDLSSIKSRPKNSEHTRAFSPSKPLEKSIVPATHLNLSPTSPVKTDSLSENKYPVSTTPGSSERQRTPKSIGRLSPDRELKGNHRHPSISDEPRQLRTPSPTKKTSIVTETSTDFIMTEREQEILNKVQKSLRKLSPDRKEKSPSRERSLTKNTTSLQDLNITTSEIIETDMLINEDFSEIMEEQATKTSRITRPEQPKSDKSSDPQTLHKPSSRNSSQTKRTPSIPVSNKVDKSPESLTKSRSISPKKPVSHVEQPQSPQVPRASGIKPREQIRPHLIRKPTPATLSPTKIDRITTEVKKTNVALKQNIHTKTTTLKTTNRSIPTLTNKNSEVESKRSPTPKGTKENFNPKKEIVTRTTSDIAMKPKKTASPQRIKSKPEIQVIDLSTKSPKSFKPIIKEPHSKMPSKPKSATALNTSTDEDDIIIDVQQSKSSRENSPDRICPTPINFSDDIGIPRFPDEVSEPDDEFVKRAYHTIHETESVVDDIVEICEDEELFVKKSNMDIITEQDDSLLSVNDKVSKFTNKIRSVVKPKETTATTKFKDTEKRVHSDFVDESLKSDECLLTVSEKVNKFAKGPRDTKESRSPSRKITDEYDKETDYTDDYTKLSVNDKAHLFIETAENVKVSKGKPAQKVERPDLSHVDESLKSDDCLLSVSDKVSKFVKTAEQYMIETHGIEDTENKIKEQHEKIMRQIVNEDDYDDTFETKETIYTEKVDKTQDKPKDRLVDKSIPRTNEPKTSKEKFASNSKPAERIPAVKITTLRSSEAVKKAKALFENIASTQKTTHKDSTHSVKTTKLTDIGVINKLPKTDSTTVLHPSVEDVSPPVTDVNSEDYLLKSKDYPSSGTHTVSQNAVRDEKLRNSPSRLTALSPEVPRSKSPMRHSVQTTTTKTVLSKYPGVTRAESPRQRPESPRQRPESPRRTESPKQRPESDKPEKVPGYLRPTKTSQIKEETKIVEDAEVSSRRGSGKFGVELRRTSVERSTVSSERRRSVDHHQPCIEDIFDLDLLEQMLEKVVGYEQRRRIRAQIRIAKNQNEHVVDTNTYTRTVKQTTTTTTKTRSPERKVTSPERVPKSTLHRTISPERHAKSTPSKTISEHSQSKEPTLNGHSKDHTRTVTVPRQRPHSPEKPAPKSSLAPRTPVRQPSPDKRRTVSPSKVTSKPKGNRFNEYASAYMKKVGLNETDKVKFTDTKTKKTTDIKQTIKHEKQQETVQEFTTTKGFTERTSSKDVIELIQTNGRRSPSPRQRQSPERKVQFPDSKIQVPERKTQSPERKAQSPVRKEHSPERRAYSPEQKAQSPERLHQRTPSPDFKRPKSDTGKETNIKTLYDIEKKVPVKSIQEDKPSWVTNRNLKKITSETRTYSSKKIENGKPKYRAPSPSKVITKPIDVITSSYGPGPLDADGKPLFGIKALRNGASNFQVKGTVIRSEFHSRNGGAPQGSVSVTAYSSQPEELQQLLAAQGEPPSRIHGLAAITTTKSFGGDTGNSLATVHTKEDRASLEQFTHHDRRVEHLERSYDSTQEFSEETSTEFSTSRRIEARNDRESDRNDRQADTNDRQADRNDRYTDRNDRQTDRNDRQTDRSTKREKVTEVKRAQKVEERREKMEKRDDKKTVRQSSVKSLTEKFIKSANDSGKGDRSTYPKAGLILRTTTAMRDSVSSDDAHPGLVRTDSEHSVCSADEVARAGGVRSTRTTLHRGAASAVLTHHEPVLITKKTSTIITQEPVITHSRIISTADGRQETVTERSFLDSTTKVSGVQDILTRMKNADIVVEAGDSAEDAEARALLNKFLGATVLMAGMQGHVHPHADNVREDQETVRSGTGGKVSIRRVEELDLDQCWDEKLLKKLLDECTDYEQRRRLRARLRTLMAEQEACASAVTAALGAGGEGGEGGDASDAREEEEVTVTSSVRRDSSDKTVSSTTTTKTTKVIEMTRPAPKPVSPFAKFRQLEKQNSTNSPNSPKTPQSPGSPSQPYFKFTDPALQSSALTIKERLLQWCRDKTRDYENVKLENFSTSWADGLAFCALVHHFLPDAFDYSKLTPDRRRHNFTLAFKVADEKAGIYPLLDVDDMVAMRKPDWKCVFTYVQAIYRRFKDDQ